MSQDNAGLVTALSAGVAQADGSISPGRQSLVNQGTGVTVRVPAPVSAGLTVGEVTAGVLTARPGATLQLAVSQPGGALELNAGQGAVNVIADQLSVRAASDPQGTQGLALNATNSTLTAGTVQLGGTQSAVSLTSGPLAGELSVTTTRLSLRDNTGSERISLDATTSTLSADSVALGGSVSLAAGNAGVLTLSAPSAQPHLGVGTQHALRRRRDQGDRHLGGTAQLRERHRSDQVARQPAARRAVWPELRRNQGRRRASLPAGRRQRQRRHRHHHAGASSSRWPASPARSSSATRRT